MSQSTTPPPPPPGGQDFRSLPDTQRATEGRVVAGVAAGLGRRLGIDPVIVRVVFVALCFAGLAGLVLYATLWFALPSDDGRPSVMADWFRLGANEPQIRTGALILGGALAFASVVGDGGWFWGVATPIFSLWLIVPALFCYWLFVVLPRGKGQAAPPPRPTAAPDAPPAATPPTPLRRSFAPPVLFLVTMCALLIALGVLAAVHAGAGLDLPVAAYPALALGVVGAGLLVGARWGRSIALVPVGLLLCLVLAVSALVPDGPVGEFRPTPASAADVRSDYELGLGDLRLDLSQVDDPDELLGRTVAIDAGVGQVTVIVPADLPVRVESRIEGGEIVVFDQRRSGREAVLETASGDEPRLTLVIDQTFGQTLVERA
ncbi:MAG: PspC domain-containing protein [Aeromicrobium sp.]|uniref:PspC domain-containing protein n=1 Tax=Aeromicrobium sp. TaxID=1871063 RepID=UPI0039E270A8